MSIPQGASYTTNSTQPFGTGFVRSTDADLMVLPGSFQGFAATILPAQQRGNFFTVTFVSTGHYRVALKGLYPTTKYSGGLSASWGNPTTSTAPGWPQGLIVVPYVWITSETVNTAPTYGSLGGGFQVYAAPLDQVTNVNTFDIFCYTCGSNSLTLASVGTADRINFLAYYKLGGTTP